MVQSDESESPKRRAILNAASDLFVAKGYGAVSMDAVARAADVSKATLYAYFESKDQLFATIIRVACQENIVDAITPGEDARGDDPAAVETTLTMIGGLILRFFLRPRTLATYRLVVAESARFPELGQAFHQNGPAAGRTLLAGWMARQPSLSVPDPEVAADQFLGMLRTGLFNRATLGIGPEPTEAEIDAVVAAAVRTFLRAFGG